MGAVFQLHTKKYEMQYRMYYTQGKLNLKNDEISRLDAEKYIEKLNHKNEMKNILSLVK